MVRNEVESNRRRWDELVPIHAASRFYDIEGFKRGRSTLLPVELEELGDLQGKRLLHLQCHFGLDSLSLARAGASVTGVDFSPRAIALAKEISNEIGVKARFVESDVYDLPKVLDERFDLIFSSYGVLCWLPDLPAWASVISEMLDDGGTFLLVEDHPLASLIDEKEAAPIRIVYPYFSDGRPTRFDVQGTYTDRSATVENSTSFEWTHPLSEIIDSLIGAGLRIEHVHEFPFSFFQRHASMRLHPDGTWHFPNDYLSFPMLLSIKAKKPNLEEAI
ncbi:MAG: methyltransferase domain-containing protein [Methanomassiliicoccales archaeon]|nr:methyltransferase domain-containing protein [Methanomassiliicoccales archaeon]MDD1755226.1 methyltransferase domain-containing protein [Methanomassiliicoccales archaeon]